MVIEDDPASRELATEMLVDAGYHVVAFEDGAAALKGLATTKPHLVISDLSMPNVDGFEFCLAVRAKPEFHDLPIIFVSATAAVRKKLKAFDSGGNAFLEKTLDEKALCEKVANILEMQGIRSSMNKLSHDPR